MARRDENGVYWMNVHDAAAQFRRRGIDWHVEDVFKAMEVGLVRAAKQQTIGRTRWQISSVEVDRVVKLIEAREDQWVVEMFGPHQL